MTVSIMYMHSTIVALIVGHSVNAKILTQGGGCMLLWDSSIDSGQHLVNQHTEGVQL